MCSRLPSENNIPIVGKIRCCVVGRCNWLRIDRYFATNDYREDGKIDKSKVSDDVQVNYQESLACSVRRLPVSLFVL